MSADRQTQTLFWKVMAATVLGAMVFSWVFQDILAPFLLAFFLAYVLQPLMVLGQKWCRLSRNSLSLIFVALIVAAVLTILFVSIPLLVKQLLGLSRNLPHLLADLKTWAHDALPQIDHVLEPFGLDLTQVQNGLSDHLTQMGSWLLGVVAQFLQKSAAVVNLLSLVVLMPLIVFYTLRDWPRIQAFFTQMLPHQTHDFYAGLLGQLENTLKAYVRGQTMVCGVLGLYYVITLNIIGLNFATPLGLVGGLLAFVPYVGYGVTFATAVGIAFAQFGLTWPFFVVVGIFLLAQVLENVYLIPQFVGDQLGLHPVWIVFALMAGGVLLGFTGVLIAVPVAALLSVILRYLLTMYKTSGFFQGTI
jgi:predicted PurR-regulated permease PerM